MRRPLPRSAAPAAAAVIAAAGLALAPVPPAGADEPEVIRGGEVSVPPERQPEEQPEARGKEKAAPPESPYGPGWWQVSAPLDVGSRVVSFGFTLLGPGFFLASTPVAALGGLEGLRGSLERLVVCPFKYTFVYPWRWARACPEQSPGSS